MPAQTDCHRTCPFAYLLALLHALNQERPASELPQPLLQSQTDLRTEVFKYISQENRQDDIIAFLQQARLHRITSFSEKFGQRWLRPINDFSIPPNYVYQRIAAWQLLDSTFDTTARHKLKQQVAIVAAGGYNEAGITKPGADNFPMPMAMTYWREWLGAANSQDNFTDYPQWFTGAEAHAYTMYHLLRQRLVVPIPDVWMIAVAALLGKGTTLVLMKHHHQRQRWAIGLSLATAAYGIAGLQIYVSAGVLLPWFLPTITLWIYILPALRRKFHE